jgi:hypothetical protein
MTGPEPEPQAPAGTAAIVATSVIVMSVVDPFSYGPVRVVRAITVASAGTDVNPATLCQLLKLVTIPKGPLAIG